jgi:hypothetical protein
VGGSGRGGGPVAAHLRVCDDGPTPGEGGDYRGLGLGLGSD